MRSIFFSVTGLFLLTSASAWATPNFPPGMEQDLELDAQPACGLCHTDGDQGGLGTVNTPFGKSLRTRGLVAFDTASLKTALEDMESEKVNSAGACLDDIDELKSGGDPNEPGSCNDGGAPSPVTNAASDAPTPSSGCAVSPAQSSGEFAAAFVIGIAVLAARRRRRQAK